MAHLTPISVRLVDAGWTARVPAPAHDSLTPAERRRHIEENPFSFLTVNRTPDDLPPGREWDEDKALAAGDAALARLLDHGAFSPVSRPSMYLYRLSTDDHTQTGVVCGAAIDDYDTGVIRVHEQVQESRAEHLAKHLSSLRVQSSPIAMAHRPNDDVRALVQRVTSSEAALIDFTAGDGLRQTVWSLDEEQTAHLRAVLADEPLYLIDGHHRAAAVSRSKARSGGDGFDTMLSAVFSTDELHNEAFHRSVRGLDVGDFLARLHDRFPVRTTTDYQLVLNRAPAELALCTNDGWHLVTMPDDDGPGELATLDPVRLQRHVLGPLVGLDPSYRGDRVQFYNGRNTMADLERVSALVTDPAGDDDAVWAMRPVRLEQLIATSDAGLTMPPKSTFFRPKVRSGVFLRLLER